MADVNVNIETEKTFVKLQLSDEEAAAVNSDINLLVSMRMQKEASYGEIDDMTPRQYYESNRKKDLSYIPKKRNRDDIRIVTGTTREKDTTLLSTLLNLNAVPDVTAFDSDDLMVADLGDNMSDLIKKTRELEDWQKLRPIVYRELISQGDVFLYETHVDDYRNVPLEEVSWDPVKDGAEKLSFKERFMKVDSLCKTRMIKQPNIYLGDMKIEYIEDQDSVAIVSIMGRGKAKSQYGNWARWKNVPYTIDTVDHFEYEAASTGVYKTWAMFDTTQNQVSEVWLFKKTMNRVQLYLNGVPMLPVNFPLTAIQPSGELPFTQGKLEPISGFALSKSQPSKVKVDQEVLDELTQLMVTGIRQSRKPPMGTKGKTVYSDSIFRAGVVTNNIKENTFSSILPPEALGLKNGEFSFYNLIKESISDKSVNDVYSGASDGGVDTLGQAEQMKEQQLLKLGSALDGVMNMERRMAWLRIDTIIHYKLQPQSKKYETDDEGVLHEKTEYKPITAETTTENGEKGSRIFRFTDDEEEYPDVYDQMEEENELSKLFGENVRISYLNPMQLRAKKHKWFIVINPTPRSNDKLSQLLFVQNVRTAFELFGPTSLNLDYIKQRYAILINEDYSKMFRQMGIMDMINGMAPTGEETGGVTSGKTRPAPVKVAMS